MVSNEGFKRYFRQFKRIRIIAYIAIIIAMLTIGTWLILDPRLQSRISTIAFPPEIFSNSEYNYTSFYFEIELEIWNPSILPRYVRTPYLGYMIYPCIGVTFTNLTGYNSHVVVNQVQEQDYDEYIFLLGPPGFPMVGKEIISPGLSIEPAYYGMRFNEANLSRLPLGEYLMWVEFKVIAIHTYSISHEIVSSTVTLQVLENEIFVIYDTIIDGWGRKSLFSSCLLYYVFGGLMIIISIVYKLEKWRKNRLKSFDKNPKTDNSM